MYLHFRIYYIALLIISSSTYMLKASSPEIMIDKIISNYEKNKYFTFNIEKKSKPFFQKDTTISNFESKMIKNDSDIFVNGSIWFSMKNVYETYYNMENIYQVNHSTKSIYIRSFITDSIKANPDLKREYYLDYFWDSNNFFIKPQILSKVLQDTTLRLRIDTILNDNSAKWKLTVFYVDEGEFSDIKKTYFIGEDYYINKIQLSIESHGEYQFDEWIYKNLEHSIIETSQLNKRIEKYLRDYNIIDKNSNYTENRKDSFLPVGSLAPSFDGYYFQEERNINIDEYKGKLIILDFWYMSCYACHLAIPSLIEMNNKYSDKGLVVLGINHYDSLDAKREILTKFIKNREINYPIILTDKSDKEKYQVYGYPTLFLIDRSGKVVFSGQGYSENKMKELEEIIKSLIKTE